MLYSANKTLEFVNELENFLALVKNVNKLNPKSWQQRCDLMRLKNVKNRAIECDMNAWLDLRFVYLREVSLQFGIQNIFVMKIKILTFKLRVLQGHLSRAFTLALIDDCFSTTIKAYNRQ